MMRVYQRQETGVGLRTEDVPFYPFFFLTDIRLLHGFPRDKFRCKTLQGSNAYRYLVVFTTWQTHWDAVSHIAKVTGYAGITRPSRCTSSPTRPSSICCKRGVRCSKR